MHRMDELDTTNLRSFPLHWLMLQVLMSIKWNAIGEDGVSPKYWTLFLLHVFAFVTHI